MSRAAQAVHDSLASALHARKVAGVHNAHVSAANNECASLVLIAARPLPEITDEAN